MVKEKAKDNAETAAAKKASEERAGAAVRSMDDRQYPTLPNLGLRHLVPLNVFAISAARLSSFVLVS